MASRRHNSSKKLKKVKFAKGGNGNGNGNIVGAPEGILADKPILASG